MSETVCDVVILGGGAAGLMCAATAAARGLQVRVIEHANRVGKKILMSGGGRCNFTNLYVEPDHFLSANPHFCKSALARYTQWDFIAEVERHGIAYHEKELGQLFCDESSKHIVRLLTDACAAAGAEISVDCAVLAVDHQDDRFQIQTSSGALSCAALVVATGGLSIPKMGATGFGYALARRFGHTLQPTRAGLVPLTLSGRPLEQIADLAGVALPVEAACGEAHFAGGLLFTHRGISGPAVLQLSSYWNPGAQVEVDLLPGVDIEADLLQRQRDQPGIELKTALADRLPKRLAQRLCEIELDSRPLRQYRATEIAAIGRKLAAWPIVASGTEGYRTAEVTVGGVDVDAVSSTTMESKLQPGLYFVGEVLDVTGHLGGFNFQWAWSSAVAAGQAVCAAR